MKDDSRPDAYCGLYCASCPSWDSSCSGCKSGNVREGWCSRCTIKACAKGKGVDFCIECGEYPCEKLKQFGDDPQYPYHGEIFGYQTLIAEKGEEKWLEEMRKRWSCPGCGTPFNWWTLICGKCGYQVNGYRVPGGDKPG